MDLIVSPAVVALNTQSGAPKLAMTPGQLIDALVLQLIDATTVRLAIADSVVDVKTEVPLLPGAQVRLAVRGHGDEMRWVIVGSGGATLTPVSRGQAAQQPAPSSTPHPALPATEVKIGATTSQPDADSPATASLRPELSAQTAPRPQPTAPTAAAEFARATRSAAAQQSGLAPVFAELRALVQMPQLPSPVRRAATQVLSAAAHLEEGAADSLRQAISRSGLFLEARVAASAGMPPAGGDLKMALLTLRHALNDWMETMPATLAALAVARSESGHAVMNMPADIKPPPPPYRGAPTMGQQPLPSEPIAEASLPELARTLVTHTDGAIARQVLMQVASLPDSAGIGYSPADAAETHWNLEIPFATPQGAAIAHFEIARDSHKGSAQTNAGTAWRANFSLDFEPIGPVHAQIALTGKRAAVRIWAERKDTAAMLRAGTADLSQALRLASLDAGDVIVRDGAPPRPLKPNPGRFLDRAS